MSNHIEHSFLAKGILIAPKPAKELQHTVGYNLAHNLSQSLNIARNLDVHAYHAARVMTASTLLGLFFSPIAPEVQKGFLARELYNTMPSPYLALPRLARTLQEVDPIDISNGLNEDLPSSSARLREVIIDIETEPSFEVARTIFMLLQGQYPVDPNPWNQNPKHPLELLVEKVTRLVMQGTPYKDVYKELLDDPHNYEHEFIMAAYLNSAITAIFQGESEGYVFGRLSRGLIHHHFEPNDIRALVRFARTNGHEEIPRHQMPMMAHAIAQDRNPEAVVMDSNPNTPSTTRTEIKPRPGHSSDLRIVVMLGADLDPAVGNTLMANQKLPKAMINNHRDKFLNEGEMLWKLGIIPYPRQQAADILKPPLLRLLTDSGINTRPVGKHTFIHISQLELVKQALAADPNALSR